MWPGEGRGLQYSGWVGVVVFFRVERGRLMMDFDFR